MIRGAVNSRREAVVQLRVRGPGGIESAVDVIVDTGFTSALTLPPSTVTASGLVRLSGGSGTLADGSVSQFDICAAEVQWEGAWRTVLAYAVGNEALMGMHLLSGNRLAVDVVPRGVVEIGPLPRAVQP